MPKGTVVCSTSGPSLTPTRPLLPLPAQCGAAPGPGEAVGTVPCRLQGVLWGVLVTPGLGDRVLDRTQDDSMGKKCPQEGDLALTAKTTRAYHSPSLSPHWDGNGGSGLSSLTGLMGARARGEALSHSRRPFSQCRCLSVPSSAPSLSIQPHPSLGPHSAAEPLPRDLAAQDCPCPPVPRAFLPSGC